MFHWRDPSGRSGRGIPWWVWLQILLGCAYFVNAADLAAIDGGLARRLEIPPASFAEHSLWLIPIVALLPCFLPRRIPAMWRIVTCDAIVLGLVLLPLAVVAVGTRSLPVSNVPHMSSPVLFVEPGVPVAFDSDGDGTRAVFARSHDLRRVRAALLRHGIQIRQSP